jgi:hypothetical protein
VPLISTGGGQIEIVQEPNFENGSCTNLEHPCHATQCRRWGTLKIKNVSGGSLWYCHGAGATELPDQQSITVVFSSTNDPVGCSTSGDTTDTWNFHSSANCASAVIANYGFKCSVCSAPPL